MRRKTKRLLLEFSLAAVALAALTVFMIPKFLAAQNINTPSRIPDPIFRAFLEEYFKVGPNGVISVQQTKNVKSFDFTSFSNRNQIVPQIRALGNPNNPAGYSQTVAAMQSILDGKIRDLTGLELFSNLEILHGNSRLCGNLDFSFNPALRVIECDTGQIQSLNVANNPNLERLSCRDNQLAQLDVSKNPKLKILNCSRNQLQRLDVTSNPDLERLDCSENQLPAIDVSKNRKLTLLDLSFNRFTAIPDLRPHTKLEALSVEFNFLGEDSLPVIRSIEDRFTGEWSILRNKVYRGFLYEEQNKCNLSDFEKQ